MQTLDSILVFVAVFTAIAFVAWRIRLRQKGKAPCCGKGCGCIAPKLRSKIPVKKA